jgi:hypothetical protein
VHPKRLFLSKEKNHILLACEEPVGVPGAVDVEANQLSEVVDAVDGGRPDAVRVVDRLKVRIGHRIGQQEAVHLASAVHIGTNDLIKDVDAKGGRAGRVREQVFMKNCYSIIEMISSSIR